MNVPILVGIFVLAGLAADVRAAEPEAWWEICDSCITDRDFNNRALQIPGFYTLVYITNRSTNETRRFKRIVTAEDRFDSRELLIEVFEEPMPTEEKAVFSQTVQNADTVFFSIDRGRFDGFAPGGRDSVVGDIQNGRLDTQVLSGLRSWLRTEGYAGSSQRVSSHTGVDLKIVSLDLHIIPGGGIRTSELQIKVSYPDGSWFSIVISHDFTEWSDLAVKDANGTPIPIEDPDDPDSFVDTDLIDGRELVFQTSNPQFIENFLSAIERRSGGKTTCEQRQIAAGKWAMVCTYSQ